MPLDETTPVTTATLHAEATQLYRQAQALKILADALPKPDIFHIAQSFENPLDFPALILHIEDAVDTLFRASRQWQDA